ncbi:MAG: phosphatidate cytidylyltransferase [Bacillota bacterium]|jgi:phosphatidate cytidylyltransferase
MLATRVASALVFGPLLIAAGWFGGPLLWLLTAAVVVLGLLELDRLLAVTDRRAWPALTLPVGLGLVAAAASGRPDLLGAVLSAGVLAAVFAPALFPGRVKAGDGVASVFALAYLPWLASHFILLRGLPGGAELFLFALFGTWVFDSGSYFAGRAFGRRKLAPRVSPGKTFEGLLGGAAAGLLFIGWLGLAWLGLGPLESGLAAVVIMTAAQLGDLAESALKRQSGVKDSGALIPGHGGVLDRFDSLLGVMPAVYYLWWLWLGA